MTATSSSVRPGDSFPAHSETRAGSEILLYAAAIFGSAFLLFEVQPVIAKIILPWFGGVAAVWMVCLMFFQLMLLLGYWYAHLLTTKLAPRRQAYVHAGLAAVSLLALPIIPSAMWRTASAHDPALRIVVVLTISIGLPYFLLSSTSPLLQAWYTRSRMSAVPYRWYALSNAGSMLALLSYPIVVEPRIATRTQAIAWSFAYAGIAVLCAALGLMSRGDSLSRITTQPASAPAWTTRALWLALAACGSALLLAITNHISQNIASVPFLWILPLSLYLLTFILCFEGRSWYRRNLFLRLLGVALGGMTYALAADLANPPVYVLIPLFCAGLFITCMFCHGELAAMKPDPAHLTSFYLTLALGGGTGAVLVAWVAPHVFRGLYELPVALGACAILALVVLRARPDTPFYRARWQLPWLGLVALAIAMTASLYVSARRMGQGTRVMVRNFYGVLRVSDVVDPKLVVPQDSPAFLFAPPDPRYRELLNGTINHGLQLLAGSRRREPTTYYGPKSGIGVALREQQNKGALRVGIVGLGAGTIATYGRAGDRYIFYEINPLVVEIAKNEFSFLRDSAAAIDIVPGDA